jgi:SET domain-containing protein
MTANDSSNDVTVQPSGIHGTGLFAKRAFKTGEIVLQWKLDVTIAAAELAALPSEEHKYVHPLDEKTYVILQPPERFVNHSCDNNTVARNFADVAIRDIRIGEEITSNYSVDGASQSFACSCRAHNCRGTIDPA